MNIKLLCLSLLFTTNSYSNETSRCNRAMKTSTFNKKVDSLLNESKSFISFKYQRKENDDEKVYTNNLKIKGCTNEQSSLLKKDLEEAINQGVSCLARIHKAFKAYPEEDVKKRAKKIQKAVQKIMGNFSKTAQNPFTLQCNNPIKQYPQRGWRRARKKEPENHIGKDTYGFASTCDDEYFKDEKIVPGMQINKVLYDSSILSKQERLATLFHEFFHHTGYYHNVKDGENDWTYNVEFCCFGLGDKVPNLEGIENSYTCRSLISYDHGSKSDSSLLISDGMIIED